MHVYQMAVLSVLGLAMVLAPGAAVGLDVTSGLTHNQVLQCDHESETADATLEGASPVAGSLQARVVASQRTVQPWTELAEVAAGDWEAMLADIPVGGPYRIDLAVLDANGEALSETSIHQVLVGDLWILAGQSNMQGVGNQQDMETPDPQVHVFRMNHTWQLATEPLHNLAESPDSVHYSGEEADREAAIAAWRDGAKGAGLGLSFAKTLVEHSGRPVGLVAVAHGGTTMGQWNPELKDQDGASLYGSMLRSVEGAGGKVRGVVWYQGESDANPDAAPLFEDRCIALINAFREDLNDPDMPFLQVQLGRVYMPWNEPQWNEIQNIQLAMEQRLDHVGTAPAVDLELEDIIHIGTPGLKVLGERLALLAMRDVFDADIEVGPRPVSAQVENNRFGRYIRVRFDSVNGGLHANGPVHGFTLHAGETAEPHIGLYKQEVDPEDPYSVLLWIQELPEDANIWYGRGLSPYCNLVDEAGMAAPVFGPLAVE